MLIYLLIFIMLFVLEVVYLKIATIIDIKDTPNHRSAHTKPTIRGGAIIIVLAIVIYSIFFQPSNYQFYYLLIGVLLVATVSFIDDIVLLSSRLRLLVHFTAFSLIFYSLNLFSDLTLISLLLLIFMYMLSIGFLNIYNFMDGINGITFLNALVSFSTLLYLNKYYFVFIDSKLLIVLILAVLVFGFFNFRKKAICFAGDIGSITIGFSLIYFVLKLYLTSHNPAVFLIFAVYLLDGGWTIIERLFRKENIFEAHRRHLYQLLANDLNMDHLKISTYYFLLQVLVNSLLILSLDFKTNQLIALSIIAISLSFIYLIIKRKAIKKSNIL